MSTVTVVDVLRVIILALGAGVMGVTAVVLGRYAQAYVSHRRRARVGDVEPWRGLLPLHVVTVAASYLLFLGAGWVEVLLRIHQPLAWQTPVYLVALLFGLWSMWSLLGHQRHRKLSLTQPDPEEPWESEGFDTER